MDSTNKPLRIPVDFPNYAEEKGVFQLFQHMLSELLLARPEQPLKFLRELLSRPDEDVAQVVVYGPPSSGQHSVSKGVANRIRAVHINPRQLLHAQTGRTLKIEGQPPDMMADVIYNRLQQQDCKDKGWVMEGYPRTRAQIQALQAKGVIVRHFVHLLAPDSVLTERYMGKRVDPITQDIYHLVFNPPADPEVAKRVCEEEGGLEVNMRQTLLHYHQNSFAVLESYKHITKTFNADQPLQDLITQVAGFLSTRRRSAAPHTPRVLLLGPTGAGKSVQAAMLAEKYRLVDVDCRSLLNQTLQSGSSLSDQIKTFINGDTMQVHMVPDHMMDEMVAQRLNQLDCASRGWVLHGYPISREQAELLASAKHQPNRVFFIDVPLESVKERLCLRRTDPVTGERYHQLYKPPPAQEINDRLLTHPWDLEENVTKRWTHYNLCVDDLAEYYSDAQRINADQDPYTVHEILEASVIHPLPKMFPMAQP